jgi:AmmeMemoRadiSam system protein A
MLYLAENLNLKFDLIDYSNSGDSPYGTKTEVVGYNAISLSEKTVDKRKDAGKKQELSFTKDEKDQLFALAGNAIRSKLDSIARPIFPDKLAKALHEPMGAFVTLKINGKLRGCIGRFISSEPLYEVVQQSALSSAFDDPRFTPLSIEEFEETEMEITVLGPLRKIDDINEIEIGRHGIFIKKDTRSGTMLPQVATENGWTVQQLLGYTSRDKAGLGWDGWKDAEIYIYEGLVLEKDN